jgi:hypothetical protein
MQFLAFYVLLSMTDWHQDDGVLRLDLIDDRSCWYYVVPRDGIVDTPSSQKVAPNGDGVVYISKKRYDGIKNLDVLKNGVDVENFCYFLGRIKDTDGRLRSYELVTFYYQERPDPECCVEDKRGDPEVFTKYSRLEELHRDSLITQGRLKVY